MNGKDARPTIVILDSSVAVTGGFRCAQRFARLLAPWANFVLVLPRRADIAPQELEPFAAVERLGLVQLRKSTRSVLAYGPALLASALGLRRLLDKHGAPTLVVNDFFQLQGWAVRKLGWKGRVLTWVRFDPWRFPGPVARSWLNAAAAASQHIVTVSRFIKDRLPDKLGARLIYESVDPDLGGKPLANRGRDVVCVSNYIRGKGQDHAIEAFALMAHRVPGSNLVFFGGDMGLEKNRAFRTQLEQRARDLHLTDRIVFRGFADDPRTALDNAAVALNLSESESFSLTCLEAQQLGVAVIAFRSGGPEEIIIDGETGRLLPIGDVEGVAEALFELLSDPGLAARMGKAAAASVRNRFGPKAFVDAVRPLVLGE